MIVIVQMLVNVVRMGHSPANAFHVIPQLCAGNSKWFTVRELSFTIPCFIQNIFVNGIRNVFPIY